MQYNYPKITGGYRFNLLKRCLWEVGIEPIGCGDVGEQTVLNFSRNLTSAEVALLNTLMTDNPTLPKSGGVLIVKIVDLWEKFEAFKTAVNLPNLKLYYTESVPGSGNVDTIELHHPTALTLAQKTTIKTAYTNLLT